MQSCRTRILLIVVCGSLLLGAGLVRAAPPAESAVAALIESAGGREEYPAADAIIIGDWVETTVESNGDYVTQEYTLLKILSDSGKRSHGSRTIPYNSRYMSLEIPLARVIHPDGTIEEVPESAIVDGTMAMTQQMNIFEESFRQKVITFPSVEIGDTLEWRTVHRVSGLIPDNYSSIDLFQDVEPILVKELVLSVPVSMDLHWVVRNGELEEEQRREGDRLILTWSRRNVPRIVPEPGMVSPVDTATKLLTTTFPDWPALSRFGASLNEGKAEITLEVRAKTAELTRGLESEVDKVAAIFHFVSTKIRYMGSSMDVGAFMEPHEAAYTLEKQYGVCRDKTILMIAMLGEIGVHAEDVLVNVTMRTDPDVPTIYFQHAIVYARLSDGRELYMDPTLELSASIDEPYIHGRYVLHLTPEGSDLKLVPPGESSASEGRIRAESSLDASGTLTSSVVIEGVGIYDYISRTIARQLPGFQYVMLWQNLLREIAPGAQLLSPEATDPLDLATPYRVSLRYTVPDYRTDIEDFQLLRFPLAGNALEMFVGQAITELSGLEERRYPLFLFTPMGAVQEEVLRLPEGFEVVSVPESFRIDEGPIHGAVTVSVEEGQVRFRSDYRFEVIRLEPEDYPALRKLARRIDKLQRSMIILRRTTGE